MQVRAFFKGYLRGLSSKPFYCKVYLTRRCNYRCEMCNVWTHGDQSKELPTTEYEKIANVLRQLGIPLVVITGGEPTLRSDLVEIVRIFAKNGFSVRLQSNGNSRLDNKLLQRLADAGLHDLNVSLDTLDKTSFDALCHCDGALDSAVASLKSAVEILGRGNVAISCILSAQNIGNVLDVVRFANSYDIWTIAMPVMLSREKLADSIFNRQTSLLNEMPDNEESRLLFQELQRNRRRLAVLSSSKYLSDMRTMVSSHSRRWSCDAGRLYFVVREDGGISPCDDLPALLHIFDSDFTRQIVSPEIQRAWQAQRSECAGCTHGCWHETSNLVHSPRVFFERIADYASMKLRAARAAAKRKLF